MSEERHQTAFDGLKKALTEAPVLCFSNPHRPLVLSVDASLFGLGAVLLQTIIRSHTRARRSMRRRDAMLRSSERCWR